MFFDFESGLVSLRCTLYESYLTSSSFQFCLSSVELCDFKTSKFKIRIPNSSALVPDRDSIDDPNPQKSHP